MTKKIALEGLKVLEWGNAQTVPAATKCLADHGANVIKVESTKFPDMMRTARPFVKGVEPLNNAAVFTQFNTGKMSITLDLKNSRGIEIFKKLVNWADIVVQNQKPGTAKKYGLDYTELRSVKSDIIVIKASLRGEEGPAVDVGGWGWNCASTGGHVYLTRSPGNNPCVPGRNAIPDVITSLFVVIGIMSAIDYKRRTGKGQCLDVTQFEPLVHYLGPGILDFGVNKRIQQPIGNRDLSASPHGAFRCKGEDKWCAIAVFTNGEWESFCRASGHTHWINDPRFKTLETRKNNEDELEGLINEWTRNHDAEEVMQVMQNAGVPSGILQNIDDIMERDPQVKERAFYQKVKHPLIGWFPHPGLPFILSDTPREVRTAPILGEHNEYVITKILNMSDDEFVELVMSGVLS